MVKNTDELISVLIVEDAPIFREAVEGTLKAYEDRFDVVGWADHREEAVRLVKEYVPHIVLLDLVLFRDKHAGIDVIRDVRRVSPATQVVVLTAHFDETLIFEAIHSGATTYLLKDNVSGDQLTQILIDVKNGQPPMEAEIARRLCDFFQSPNHQSESHLTARESEVLELIANGDSNQKIANELTITVRTVKTHVSNILSKLHLSNRTELKFWHQQQQINNSSKY